jgi:hypothetical protein
MDEEEGERALTYDDILETLNVRLHQGRLESINTNPGYSHSFRPTSFGSTSKQHNNHVTTLLPDNPHLQNSYIYNKYFKNYATAPQETQERKPMTREEYQRYLWEKRREEAYQRERIRQIKSTKMLYSHGGNHDIVIQPREVPSDMNKLFQCHFWKK